MSYSQFFVIPIFMACLFMACIILNRLNNYSNIFDSLARSSPLDGLRGLLALSVLLHHFYITYYWKVNGVWERPETNLLNNFGAVSVSFFFLITGYLFLNKIQKQNIDWKKLYISRIKRIIPLYFFVVIIISIITLFSIESAYTNKDLFKWIIKWIIFFGGDLNGFSTNLIIAGVNWTLIYEWGFYFSLPIIYFFIHKKINNKLIFFISFFIFVMIFFKTGKTMYMLFILSYPAILYKNQIKKYLTKYRTIFAFFIPILTSYCFLFTNAYSLQQQLILAFIFCCIANGFSFFGILKIQGMKILGDISYSIYLIHGIVLYVLFSILNIFDFTDTLLNYYLYFPFVFLVVVLLSFVSYIFIEKPFLQSKSTNVDYKENVKLT